MSVVNDIEVNADNKETFQVICRINNIGDLGKFTTISGFRLQGNSYQTLVQMQNVDNTSQHTYRKPVLGTSVSGWRAVGEYDTGNANARDSYVGVARQVSDMSCNDVVAYRCEVAYTTPSPNFDSHTGIIAKVLNVSGNVYLVIV